MSPEMVDFTVNVLLPAGVVLSLLALVHCAVTRSGVAWALIIVLLGPFGGLVYLAARWNLVQLPWDKLEGRTLGPTTETATRRCPRCQQLSGSLVEYQDGRKTLLMCRMCKSEMDLRSSDFTLPI